MNVSQEWFYLHILNLYPFPALVSLNLNACCISHILLKTSILLFCMIMHDYKVDVDRNLDNSCMITLSLCAVEASPSHCVRVSARDVNSATVESQLQAGARRSELLLTYTLGTGGGTLPSHAH